MYFSLSGSQDERICLSTVSQGRKIDVMQQCSIANRIDGSMEKYYRTLYTSKFQQASSNWMPPLICKTFETTQKLSRIICFFISSSFTFRFIYSFPHPVTKNFRIFYFSRYTILFMLNYIYSPFYHTL